MRDTVALFSLRPPDTLMDVSTKHRPAYFDAPQTAFHDDPEPLQPNKFAETTTTTICQGQSYILTMLLHRPSQICSSSNRNMPAPRNPLSPVIRMKSYQIKGAKELPEQFASRNPQHENRNMSRFRYVDPKIQIVQESQRNPTPTRSQFLAASALANTQASINRRNALYNATWRIIGNSLAPSSIPSKCKSPIQLCVAGEFCSTCCVRMNIRLP